MSTKAAHLKNQLAQTAQGVVTEQKPLTPAQTVKKYLEDMLPTMQEILPKHVTADRMTRIAFNVIKTNPKLLECSVTSLMGGVMEAAKLGLEPGMMGQCYLIPFQNKGNMEAQFIIGYKGLIDLVRRSGQVSVIEARTVFENDTFDYAYGLEPFLTHKPTMGEQGAPIAYYAVCKLKDGGSSFIVMTKNEMEKYKQKYAKSKNFGPWVSEFDAMARKTCLRQLIKYLPISIEHLSAFDERSGEDVHRDITNAQLVADGQAPVIIDSETGEVWGGEN